MLCTRTLGQFAARKDGELGAACQPWYKPGEPEDVPGCGHSNLLHQAEGACLGCQMDAEMRNLRDLASLFCQAGIALAEAVAPMIAAVGRAIGSMESPASGRPPR